MKLDTLSYKNAQTFKDTLSCFEEKKKKTGIPAKVGNEIQCCRAMRKLIGTDFSQIYNKSICKKWVLWGKYYRTKMGFRRNKAAVKIAEYLPFDMELSHEMISGGAGFLVGGDDGVWLLNTFCATSSMWELGKGFLNQLYYSIPLWGMVGKAVSDSAWEWVFKTEEEKLSPIVKVTTNLQILN